MIHAYHGSPKLFDRFTLEEYGNGDGRSIGGYGIYFTARKEVAQQFALKGGALYECEILEHGQQWLNLDEEIPHEIGMRVIDKLAMQVSREDLQQFQDEFLGSDDYPEIATGQQMYDWLEAVLGSQKKASEFLLNQCWIIGNIFEDRGTMRTIAMVTQNADMLRDDQAGLNYVVFDPNAITIKETTKY